MRLAAALFVVVVATATVASRAYVYATHPNRLPSNPDVAFYQWRSELLTARSPATLVSFDGPQGEGGSGYRVATPVLGALLRRISKIDPFTLPKFFVVGLNSLLALALGGAAYRYARDPLLFAAVTLWAGATLFWTPFYGYLDNVLALVLLVTALAFLDGGRRSAMTVAMLVFLAFLAHPPAPVLFASALLGALALRIVLAGPPRATPIAEQFLVGAALTGAIVGYAAWRLGAWGPGATLGDAIHPRPLSQEAFSARLEGWLNMFDLRRTVPLLMLGVLGLVVLERDRFRRELLPRSIVMWLLPLLGALGVFTSYGYPYHRFLAASAAPILVAGIGLWLVVRFVLGARSKPPASSPIAFARVLLALAVTVVVLVPAWESGLGAWEAKTLTSRQVEPVSAAIQAYLGDDKDPPPLVFVASSEPARAWSFRRGTSNRIRAGLPGPVITDSFVFFGSLDEFLAGRPSDDRQIAAMSRASFEEMRAGVGDRKPLVLVWRLWNRDSLRRDSTRDRLVQIDKDLFVLEAPGLVQVDPVRAAAASRAGAEKRAAGTFDPAFNLGHFIRIVVGVVLIAFLPGALALPYFGRRDIVSFTTAAPAMSLAMTAFVGFLLLAVTRQPISAETAWAIVGVTNLVGLGLLLLAKRSRPFSAASAES